MKGFVVRELMKRPDLTVANPSGTFGRRIVIPELDNLAITLFGGDIVVAPGYEQTGQTIMLKEEVDVPSEVVEAAQKFEQESAPLIALGEQLSELTSM